MKFCPNCGKQNDGTTKFCVHCGSPIMGSIQPSQAAAPSAPLVSEQQKEALKNSATNFWAWIISSFKNPADKLNVTGPMWYSWIFLVLTAIFAAITVGKIAVNAINDVAQSVGNSLNSHTGGLLSGVTNNVQSSVSNSANNTFGKMIFPLIISFVILHAAVLLGSWLANNAILGDKTFTFKKTVNLYGRFYVLIFSGTFLAFLFALINVNNLAMYISCLALLVWLFVTFFAYMINEHYRKMDHFYIKLLAWLANVAIIAIAVLIIYSIMKSEVQTIVSGYLGNLKGLL